MAIRTGMQTLIDTVRGYANAGTAEWVIESEGGYRSYWSDIEIQRVLDRNRIDVVYATMKAVQSYTGGTPVYLEYRAGYGDIESGTAVFKIENADGTISGYTMDYERGVASFTADQGGSAYFWTGRAYDLYGAAAEIWRLKAANVAQYFNFSTDGHKVDKGSLRKNYMDMADYYQNQSAFSAMNVVKIVRSDT